MGRILHSVSYKATFKRGASEMGIDKLLNILTEEFGEYVVRGEELKKHTTFKIGGAAYVFVKVQNVRMLKRVVRLCADFGVPIRVLGAGSNLIVSSDGICDSVVLSLDALNQIKRCGKTHVRVGAGVRLTRLKEYCEVMGLSGLEWSAGIPASLGGAVFMNAGAFCGDMGKIVHSVKILANGKIRKIKHDKLFFNYRDSVFKRSLDCVIIEARLRLKKSNTSTVKKTGEDYLKRRLSSQRVGYPSAGSVFKRVGSEVVPARVIDELGLKGMRVGDAEISKVHAGYIVNTGNATSRDVTELIKLVQQIVFNKLNIGLQVEVIIWENDICNQKKR